MFFGIFFFTVCCIVLCSKCIVFNFLFHCNCGVIVVFDGSLFYNFYVSLGGVS
jgi:hypothetical protein